MNPPQHLLLHSHEVWMIEIVGRPPSGKAAHSVVFPIKPKRIVPIPVLARVVVWSTPPVPDSPRERWRDSCPLGTRQKAWLPTQRHFDNAFGIVPAQRMSCGKRRIFSTHQVKNPLREPGQSFIPKYVRPFAVLEHHRDTITRRQHPLGYVRIVDK